MIAPISSLANMEMALYGGFGTNANAPSYLNGYRGGNNYSSYMNPAFYGYGNGYNNTTFGQNIPNGYGTTNSQQAQQDTIFQGLSQGEQNALMNDYMKSLAPSEGLLGCAATNAIFGLAMNPRLIAHPINSISTIGKVEKAFAGVKDETSRLRELWVKPENSNILREAYLQMHKAEARCLGKLGAFRKTYSAEEAKEIQKVITELKSALNAGDLEAIKKHTATLQHAYSSNGGFIANGWNKVKGLFVDSKPMTVAEKLKDTKGINERIATLGKTTETGFKSMLKRGGGVKGGLFFAAIELLMNFGKIKTAFEKDSDTGMKQLGQTTVKAAGSAAGWALGEAAGLWAFTKAGAAIGTALGPGVGTVIGGIVGLVGGGLGMWLAGKATNAIVGQDVADGIEAKKLASTGEGQVQLLQNTMQRMQSGEKVSAEAQQAVQKLITQYA